MDSQNMNTGSCPGQEELSAYVDGELAPDSARSVASHVHGCRNCREKLHAIEQLSRACRDLGDTGPGFDLGPHIEIAIARAVRQKRLARLRRLVPLSLATAATVALGIFVGNALVNVSGDQDGSTVPTAMAMFDVIPPGGLCIDFDSCYRRDNL